MRTCDRQKYTYYRRRLAANEVPAFLDMTATLNFGSYPFSPPLNRIILYYYYNSALSFEGDSGSEPDNITMSGASLPIGQSREINI